MSMDVLRSGAREDAAHGTATLSALLPLIAIFAFGILLRNLVVANTDVSWLITLCEKILDGERPYIDFIETNPPASIYVYMLPVIVARTLSVAPEIVTDLFIFAAAAVSLWLSARIVRAANLFDRTAIFQLAALFGAIFLLLPAQTFGEREHIAIITFLPLLALSAVRANGKSVSLVLVIAAGFGAGVTAIIKPHFACAIVLIALISAWPARKWNIFFALENWIAGAMLAAYGAFVYFAFPVFIEKTLPLVAEIYVPVRAPVFRFLLHFATPIYLLVFLSVFLIKGREALRAPFSLLLAASVGFSVSYYSQLKGWAYHSYPMLAFALAAAVIAFAQRWPLAADVSEQRNERAKRIASAFSIALLAGATFLWMNFAVDMRALRDPIARVAPKPTMIAITSDIAIGHPLTRSLNGTWVGRVCSQWIVIGAEILKRQTSDQALHRRYDELAAQDRTMLIEDIRRAKPDIILVDRVRFDWWQWAQRDAALMREIDNYRLVEEIHDVMILRRK